MQIYSTPSEFDSVKKLGFPVFLNEDELDKKQMILRWGVSDYKETFPKVLNNAEAIFLNVDKLGSLRALEEKSINVPNIYEFEFPIQKLCVLRKLNHSNGKDFKLYFALKRELIPFEWYATEYINTPIEYRVWFCKNKTLMAQRVSEPNSHGICRSNWGYKFVRHSEYIAQQTIKARKCIGLDVGAADILIKNNKLYFLELNSAPSIDDPIIETFFKENLMKYD